MTIPIPNRLPNPSRATVSPPIRPGFTLVELMVVIAIIGILMGLLIPGVMGVVEKGKETAIKVEIGNLDQAMEAYKLKYSEYPPDFSDWKSVERHFRKAFPDIDDDELRILAQFTFLDDNYERVDPDSTTDPRVGTTYEYYRQCMDPAEALVFCLGGFSKDAKKPFTGQGGPLSLIVVPMPLAGDSYNHFQYNVERDNAIMELDINQLSKFVANDPTTTGSPNPCSAPAGAAYTYSSDEYVAGTPTGTDVQDQYTVRASGGPFAAVRFLVDPFPVFTMGDDNNPLVYFNAKSYDRTFEPPTVSDGWLGAPAGSSFHALNVFYPPNGDDQAGIARPYLTNQVDTNAGGFLWAENKRFQLIMPGRDSSFGGVFHAGVVDSTMPSTAQLAGFATVFPTGQFADAAGALAGGGQADKFEDNEAIVVLQGVLSSSPATSFYTTEYAGFVPQEDNITNFSSRTLATDLP